MAFDPVRNLVRELGAQLAPLGVTRKVLLSGDTLDDHRPWYVPALHSEVVDAQGRNARQIMCEGVESGLAFQNWCLSVYAAALASENPATYALAAADGTKERWPVQRAYAMPVDGPNQWHQLALQLAVGLRDLAGGTEVAQDNTYLVRTATHALGVLEGKLVGTNFDLALSSEDLEALLRAPGAVYSHTVRPPLHRARRGFDQVWKKLPEPGLTRDMLSLLGLVTARNCWFAGGPLDKRASRIEAERLADMIATYWLEDLPVAPKEAKPRLDIAQQIAVVKQKLQALEDAEEALHSRELSDASKMRVIRDILVPHLWGEGAFKTRVYRGDCNSALLNSALRERMAVTFQLFKSKYVARLEALNVNSGNRRPA